MPIPIVFSTDHNFVMPTGVSIHSLLKHAKEDYEIYILMGEDVTEEDKGRLKKEVEQTKPTSKISFIELKDEFSSGYEVRGISKACYYRLLIPWLLPDVDKIIYSDGDIIFKKDISELMGIDLGDNYIGAIHKEAFVTHKKMCNHIKKIGASPEKYVNSGFLVINSKKQREDNLKSKYIELARNRYKYQDQDILNIVCLDRIKFIDGTYNVTAKFYNKFNPKDVKVIHYTGFKPWNAFTFCWVDWWDDYNTSTFYQPELNYKISARYFDKVQILKDSWALIKNKFFNL